MSRIDDRIVALVARLQRNYQGGIYAYMIQARLDEYRAEQTLRRDMYRLWREGRLERIGGERARRGYVVPPTTFREALGSGADAATIKRLGDEEVRAAGEAARRRVS